MRPQTRAHEITPDMVLAYREALADTRRLTSATPIPMRPRAAPVARPVHDDIQRDHAIHQAGRIAFGLAGTLGLTAMVAG